MPITDNQFGADELESAIQANPALIDNILPVLTKNKYSVYDEPTLTKFKTDLETESIGKFVSKSATEFEDTVRSITGLEKDSPEEKYFDFNKRALQTFKTERDALKEELNELKGKSNITQAERDQLQALKDKVKEYDVKLKEVETNYQSQLSKAKLENVLSFKISSVSSKLIKSDIAGIKAAQGILSNNIKNEILNMAQTDSRGEVILINPADGKPMLNKDLSFVTVEQFYEAKMNEAGFIDKGRQQGGAGGEGGGNQQSSDIPGNVKTRVELMDYLRSAPETKSLSQSKIIEEFNKYAHLLPNG